MTAMRAGDRKKVSGKGKRSGDLEREWEREMDSGRREKKEGEEGGSERRINE